MVANRIVENSEIGTQSGGSITRLPRALHTILDDMERTDFTIDLARRNRISADTRLGYQCGINQVKKWAKTTGNQHLLKESLEFKDGFQLDLSMFQYTDFLSFIQWTVQNKSVGVVTLSGYRSAVRNLYIDQGVPLPSGYGDDMKIIFSGNAYYAALGE